MKQPPLTGFTLFLLVFALGLATFVESLDYSIANVAIPSIAAGFGMSAQQGTWVITLFAVTSAITLALTGWLATRFGSVKVAIWSLVIFTISSFLCGAAWSFNSLIFFRVVQGAAVGPLISLPQSLVLSNCPDEKKAMSLGFIIMILVLAPVLGPVIGGWITENYGWPWIFYINVPVGIVSILIILKILYGRETPVIKMPVDVVGIFLLVIGIGALQIFLDRGNDEDWFASHEILTLALMALVALAFFFVWNAYAEYPLIDFSYFKDTNFRVATLLTALAFLVLLGTTVLIPLYVQTQLGYTPYLAGLAVMPVGILPIFITPIVAVVMFSVGLRSIVSLSLLILAYTCFWYSELNTEVSLRQLMEPRFYQGLAVALCFLPLQQLALTNISEESLAKATGVYNFTRLIIGGGGLSTALYVTVWQRRTSLHHSDLTQVMHPFATPTVESYKILKTAGFDDQTVPLLFDGIVTNQSYLMGFNDVMWLSGWMLILLVPFVWRCKEPPKGKKVSLAMD